MDFFSTYWTFVRMAFLKMLAYRLRYYTGIFTYLLYVSVYYFIWKAVYAGQPENGEINGFTLAEMTTYIAIGWISRSFYFSNIDDDIDTLVRSGEIGTYLLRPINFQLMMLSQAVGESTFRLLFFSGPIALVLFWLYPILPPADLTSLSYFLVSTVLGFLIFAFLNFLIGMMAFSMQSIDGLIRAKQNLLQLLSGLLIPLSFFPSWAQAILNALPFKGIAYVPLQCYLGKLSGQALYSALINQLSWAVLLFSLGVIFWQRGVAKLTVQGG